METVNAFMRIIAAVLCFISVPQVEMVPINYAPFNTTAMTAVNDAGASIEIFWFNPYSEELINQTPHPIRIGTEKLFNCYEGHEFVARFQDHIEGVETKWVKLHREERVIITYDPDENKMHSQQLTIVDKVKDMINTAKSECGTEKVTALAPCVNSYLMKEMNVWQTLKENTKKSRDGMAGRLASYICNDPDVEPTKPIDFNSRLRIGRREYIVDYYLDLPESKIYVIDGFITQKQCDHLSSHMTPYDDAVVVSQDGAAESTASGDEISRPRRYWYDVDGVYPSNSAKMYAASTYISPI